MAFEPQTWAAERYLGRAESGRTRPLRLFCTRRVGEPETARESQEFFAKFIGLPEVTEQSLFAEMFGNALARSCGITTGEPAYVELDALFSESLRQVDIRVGPGVGIGSRNLGPGLGPPTFGRMSAEQLSDAATLYLFDLLVQNPDRRPDNPNCLVVSRRLAAIDFESCFSFLYPIVGLSAHAWEVSKQGIGSNHIFQRELKDAEIAWDVLVGAVLALAVDFLDSSKTWLPGSWNRWVAQVRNHFDVLRSHEQELVFEVVRSLS